MIIISIFVIIRYFGLTVHNEWKSMQSIKMNEVNNLQVGSTLMFDLCILY